MSTVSPSRSGNRLGHQLHVVGVFVALAASTAALSGWSPSPAAVFGIATIAITVGLPHGALDIALGPRVIRPAVFLVAYVVAASSVVLAWLAMPALGVVAFYTSSWYHFARGDSVHHRDLGRAGALMGVSTAGCAIGLPLVLQAGIVTPLLSELMLGTARLTNAQVTLFGSVIAAPSLVAGCVAGFVALRRHRCSAAVEVGSIALMAAVVHPLVSISIYFALWHSPRHLTTLDIDRRAWTYAIWTTVGSMLAGICAWRLIEPAAPTAVRVAFIGLAALTVPHVVTTEMLRSHRAGPVIHAQA